MSDGLDGFMRAVFVIEFLAISGFPKEHKYPISLYFTG